MVMDKKQTKLSEEIKAAIMASGQTRYAICKATGISEATMSRFINARGWFGRETLDVLAAHLGMSVTVNHPKPPVEKPPKAKRTQGKAAPAKR